MILFGSIAAGLYVAYVAYRMLFYDASDFWDGMFFFAKMRRRGGPPEPLLVGENLPTIEDLFWSGVRLVVFLAVSIAAGHWVYSQLQKHFG